MIYRNYDIHLRATVRFTDGNELKNMQVINANID